MTVLVLVYDTCWDSVAVADDVVVVVVSFLVRWRVGAGFFRVGRMFFLKRVHLSIITPTNSSILRLTILLPLCG